MQSGWVINRRFKVLPLDGPGRRWVLDSADDSVHGCHLQIVFERAGDAVLAGEIDVAEILRQPHGAPAGRYVINGSHGAVAAQAVYVHETPGAGYAAALPPQPVPTAQRLMWRLLLWLMRIPGAFALMSRLRSGRR
ncbi:MAG TPA: hypothetical protein VE046_13250 [Steroidobacteraceae bacterium]|nr:hypothetical protein [Steroidobacteraceae bacterium]